MDSLLEHSRTRPGLGTVLSKKSTKSMGSLRSSPSTSEFKPPSVQDLLLLPSRPAITRSMQDQSFPPFTDPPNEATSNTLTMPVMPTTRSRCPRNKDLHPDPLPRETLTSHIYSKQRSTKQPTRKPHVDYINSGFSQRVIDPESLIVELEGDRIPQLTNSPDSQSHPLPGQPRSPIIQKEFERISESFPGSLARSQTFNSALQVPKKIARKFSAGLLLRKSSAGSIEPDLVGGRIGLGVTIKKPVASFNFRDTTHVTSTSKASPSGEVKECLEVLKCSTPSLKSATNTQSSCASSPDLYSDSPFAEDRSDRQRPFTRTKRYGSLPQQPHQLRFPSIQTNDVEPDLPSISRRRGTFSSAVRLPKTLAQKISVNFLPSSGQEFTDSILDAETRTRVETTIDVPTIPQEFRYIDFTSKTGLSVLPGKLLDEIPSVTPTLRSYAGGEGRSLPSSQYHKPTMFIQRYTASKSLPDSEQSLSSSDGGQAEDEELESPCTPLLQVPEYPSLPSSPIISPSSQRPSKINTSPGPSLESPTTVEDQILCMDHPSQGPKVFPTNIHSTHQIHRGGIRFIRPRTAPLITKSQFTSNSPVRGSTITRPATANRGPGIEMLATLSALEELCNGTQELLSEDESVLDD
ncbi:hypothetical protein CROQUDRAFT_674010 [Cronartium quercuum f. sp. fusiforme G11]|uniref:Uncharacterized protein n=1 Tax=Cronartium quercuum f. sp. fusiforme G11 TaxID=708437 RepID=A0A9P6T7L7_9BASI|nr:hypothetical protein CROQUDRAFT_674010 [Cronartium quercuum f. sp. fusiforme G11]